jgi:hypothetical protein
MRKLEYVLTAGQWVLLDTHSGSVRTVAGGGEVTGSLAESKT